MKKFVWILAAAMLALGLAGCSSTPKEQITQKEFDRLTEGMPYEQAVQTIGGNPEERLEMSQETVRCRWKGNGEGDSYAVIFFYQDRLQAKSSHGLQ